MNIYVCIYSNLLNSSPEVRTIVIFYQLKQFMLYNLIVYHHNLNLYAELSKY